MRSLPLTRPAASKTRCQQFSIASQLSGVSTQAIGWPVLLPLVWQKRVYWWMARVRFVPKGGLAARSAWMSALVVKGTCAMKSWMRFIRLTLISHS